MMGGIRAAGVDLGPAQALYGWCATLVEAVRTGELPLTVEVPALPVLPRVVDEPVITQRRFGSSKQPAGFDHGRL